MKIFKTLPSTQDYCLEQCDLNRGKGLSVLAYQQTKQRGSRGRKWYASSGALAFSMVILPEEKKVNPSIFPFLAGLGFYTGLVNMVPSCRKFLAIKWPNDMLLFGKKLGGVLVEIDGDYIVMGFGANIATKPNHDLVKRDVACLADIGCSLPSLPEIATSIEERVYYWYREWQEKGFDVLRRAWLHHALPLGTKMTVQDGCRKVSGCYKGITHQGYLELDTCNGREVFVTADILQIQKEG